MAIANGYPAASRPGLPAGNAPETTSRAPRPHWRPNKQPGKARASQQAAESTSTPSERAPLTRIRTPRRARSNARPTPPPKRPPPRRARASRQARRTVRRSPAQRTVTLRPVRRRVRRQPTSGTSPPKKARTSSWTLRRARPPQTLPEGGPGNGLLSRPPTRAAVPQGRLPGVAHPALRVLRHPRCFGPKDPIIHHAGPGASPREQPTNRSTI
jgi:hypothetical protein